MARWNPFRKNDSAEESAQQNSWQDTENHDLDDVDDKIGQPEQSPQGEEKVRSAYYLFEHVALRDFALEMPLELLAMLADPNAREHLKELWRKCVEECKVQFPHEPPEPFPDVELHCMRVEDRLCGIIEMPPPQSITEAWFIAVLLITKIDFEQPPENMQGEVAYLVLEKGITLDGRPRTVFCEWTDDRSHRNYGDGPQPSLHAFLDRLAEFVRQKD